MQFQGDSNLYMDNIDERKRSWTNLLTAYYTNDLFFGYFDKRPRVLPNFIAEYVAFIAANFDQLK